MQTKKLYIIHFYETTCLPFKLHHVQEWQNFTDSALNVAVSEVQSDLLNSVPQEIMKLFPAQGTGGQISIHFLQKASSQFLFLSSIDTFN